MLKTSATAEGLVNYQFITKETSALAAQTSPRYSALIAIKKPKQGKHEKPAIPTHCSYFMPKQNRNCKEGKKKKSTTGDK